MVQQNQPYMCIPQMDVIEKEKTQPIGSYCSPMDLNNDGVVDASEQLEYTKRTMNEKVGEYTPRRPLSRLADNFPTLAYSSMPTVFAFSP